jgi:hypothetical protein
VVSDRDVAPPNHAIDVANYTIFCAFSFLSFFFFFGHSTTSAILPFPLVGFTVFA